MVSFLTIIKTRSLIFSPGTRFPRAPRRFAPAGSPLATLVPQESRTFRSNQMRRFLNETAGWSIPNQAGILDVFYCNPYWIEEICGTPAEKLASQDPEGA